MSRNFRLVEKKRGHRRTGSQKLGSLGEAGFFAVCFLLGCGGLYVLLATLVIPEWRVTHGFAEHRCKVLDARLATTQGEDGLLYRPEVQIEYQIGGETYIVWTYDIHTLRGSGYSADREEQEAALAPFRSRLGSVDRCWYDPADPRTAVLVRGVSWWVWMTFLVPVSFLALGGGGLLYSLVTWGKSAERRAAMVRRGARLDLFDASTRSGPEFPSVPDADYITDSPGTVLAYRLPVAGAPAWALVAWLVAAAFWNGIVWFFVMFAVGSHVRGEPQWLLTLLLIPLAAFGLWLLAMFLRQLLLATGIGPTLVEISDQPLYPGERYRLFVSQAGRLKISSLEVLLVCEEEATYRQGTNTRCEARRVYEAVVLRRAEVEVLRGLPLEAEGELLVPPEAMHSFHAAHNEVRWRIVVRSSARGWPDFQRSFPAIVGPRRAVKGADGKGRNGRSAKPLNGKAAPARPGHAGALEGRPDLGQIVP